ncbi:hypothetical protein [Actinocrispum wychmicini]|uniref:hypothetical protein n=1 Tax=Actinocrispum wychmicini TaxID=1213861 RepID=UPI0010451042|nr:hypothetical protein [Actinocrispum wychmicini]
MFDSTADPLDGKPCADCGVPLQSFELARRSGYDPNGPLWQPTILTRLFGFTTSIDIHVYDVAQEDTDGLGAAIAAGYTKNNDLRGLIFLAKDLDYNLRVDILAFAFAIYIADTTRFLASPLSYIAVGRERSKPARQGPGHLAWHILWSCGRKTSSATFDLEFF